MSAPPPFGHYEAPASVGGALPPVLALFRIYAGLVALVSSGVVLWLVNRLRDGAADEVGRDVVSLFLLLATSLAVVHGVAAFVPRKPWGWLLGAVVLGLGIPSCTFALAIPMLVYWLRPECRAAFMRA